MSNKGTILIIEDHLDNLIIARELLEYAGFRTLEVEDAEKGIPMAKTSQPNLILMDLHLPLLNGYDACHILKTDPATQHIPIVAFTALAMEEDKQKAFAYGCCGVISKPISVEHFADQIEQLLEANNCRSAENKKSQLDSDIFQSSSHFALSQAFLAKSSFQQFEHLISLASHDMQAPLRKIQKFNDILKTSAREELSAENYNLLERIGKSADQAFNLLTSLVSYARVDEREKCFETIDVNEVVQNTLMQHHQAIKDAGSSIDVHGNCVLEADPTQISRVFDELLVNALKFRRTDTPLQIVIRMERQNDYWQISFADNGIGFKQEYAKKIFEALSRLHGMANFPGNGMGLAIVKRIMERHGGTIFADGKPDEGACFTLLFPVLQSQLLNQSDVLVQASS